VVRTFGEPPLLQVDRAFVPAFGVRPFGVHCNGFVRTAAGLQLWIAERAHDKPTYPGRWDNTVAGGQPIGLSLRDNLQKECAEEAAIPAAMAADAVAVSTITYVQATPAGLKPDTLFCFDLELPAEFTPRPADGEVARFFLLPVRDVAEVVRDSERFKPNCALVLIDFFLRHGVLDGELAAPAQRELAARLRRPLLP
jgi:isopentenyldiphosphate isomerase